MIHEFAKRLSKLVADWLRVGYCQGNFNSDNCLVAGRTMDYGPFGFLEKYDPLWNMWTGGGEHFAFMNQPGAAHKNYFSFVKALAPLLDEAGAKEAKAAVNDFEKVCAEACNDMWRQKLGLKAWSSEVESLFGALKDLMAESSVDYTIMWRQLAELPAQGLTCESPADSLLQPLRNAFYGKLDKSSEDKWSAWLKRWVQQVQAEGAPQEAAALMRRSSPKYVPREWILVEAYEAAYGGDYGLVQTLYGLFSKPFDEQPEFEERYYRRAPASAQERGGTAFMS
uniref:Selenoprotein O n=1 Tax=Alexandrium catenella TaxID=2925 RepID=A0A7S1RCM1_ALECA